MGAELRPGRLEQVYAAYVVKRRLPDIPRVLGEFSPHDPSCHDRIGIEARNEEDSNLDKLEPHQPLGPVFAIGAKKKRSPGSASRKSPTCVGQM